MLLRHANQKYPKKTDYQDVVFEVFSIKLTRIYNVKIKTKIIVVYFKKLCIINLKTAHHVIEIIEKIFVRGS